MARPTWRDRLLAAAGSRLQTWGARLIARASPGARTNAELTGGPPAHWLELLQQSAIPLDWRGADASEPPLGLAVGELPADEEARLRPGQASPVPDTWPAEAPARKPPSVLFEPVGSTAPPPAPDYGPRLAPKRPSAVFFDEPALAREAPEPAYDKGERSPAGPPGVDYEIPTPTPDVPPWPDSSEQPARRPAAAPDWRDRIPWRRRPTQAMPQTGETPLEPRAPEPPAFSPARPKRVQPDMASFDEPDRRPVPPPQFPGPDRRRAPASMTSEEQARSPRAPERTRPPAPDKPPVSPPAEPRWAWPPRGSRPHETEPFAADSLPADRWPELPAAPADASDAGDDGWQALLREQRGRR